MAYRNLYVSNDVKISTQKEQLIVSGIEKTSIPLEDINCIMIDNLHSTISTYLFQKLNEYGIVLFVIDNKHLPCSVTLPFVKHSRHLKMLKYQLAQTVPQKKRLWQKIVKAKIRNQGHCLSFLGLDGDYLYSLENRVNSGDTTNVEATAAIYYFKTLYGYNFRRRNDNIVNACLNYGYSIIRGNIARTVVAHGFEPAIGIFHDNELNSYNLADDFMEPYRPFVDYYVTKNILLDMEEDYDSELNPELKKEIFSMLSYCIKSNEQEHTILNSIEMMVSSYISFLSGASKDLILPDLIELKQYEYK